MNDIQLLSIMAAILFATGDYATYAPAVHDARNLWKEATVPNSTAA